MSAFSMHSYVGEKERNNIKGARIKSRINNDEMGTERKGSSKQHNSFSRGC